MSAIRFGVRVALGIIAAVATLAAAGVVLLLLWVGLLAALSVNPATWHRIAPTAAIILFLAFVVMRVGVWLGWIEKP